MGVALFLLLLLFPVISSLRTDNRSSDIVAKDRRYTNNYDDPFFFQCSTGRSISQIYSRHHNGREDRQYGFGCRNTPGLGNCHWTGYVNNFDQPILFQCSNGVISGVYSYHSNKHEDRRFKFYCCSLKKKKLKSCSFSGYVNGWDAYFNYNVPTRKVLRGASSNHDNGREDRRWKFETCYTQ